MSSLTRGADVDVVARLRTRRLVRAWRTDDDVLIAELADDSVRASRANRDEVTFREIEFELAPDAVIADIGAGSGYYSFRIAPKIPRGRVVAVDIQPEMLDFLKKESARLGIPNVQPHLGAIDDVKLPPASLDAALMVDAYHEFDHPVEMQIGRAHV